MKLTNPTDAELNATFAEKVAGWRCFKEKRGEYTLCVSIAPGESDPGKHWDKKKEAVEMARYTPIPCVEAMKVGFFGRGLPKFTQSADAILPHISKLKEVGIHYLNGDWFVRCWSEDKNCANCDSFPRAAVIALLRANGVEVEFT